MKNGRKPSLEEVAEAALVSRATAYRYFPSVEALLVEASLDLAVPDGEALFAGDPSDDPEERVDQGRGGDAPGGARERGRASASCWPPPSRARPRSPATGVPLRQNRRTPLIEAALAPARGRFDDGSYARLCAALALIFGPESMVVFRDVLRLDDETARAVKAWAARTLVRTALEESGSGDGQSSANPNAA